MPLLISLPFPSAHNLHYQYLYPCAHRRQTVHNPNTQTITPSEWPNYFCFPSSPGFSCYPLCFSTCTVNIHTHVPESSQWANHLGKLVYTLILRTYTKVNIPNEQPHPTIFKNHSFFLLQLYSYEQHHSKNINISQIQYKLLQKN